MLIFVRLSVFFRFSFGLSRAVNPHLSGSNLQGISQQSVSIHRTLREHPEGTYRTLREYSESTQRASKSESIQSEPKNTASCSRGDGHHLRKAL